MTDVSETVSCAECGFDLDWSFVDDQSKPCPSCGCGIRQVGITVVEPIVVDEKASIKNKPTEKRDGKHKFSREQVIKTEIYRDTGERQQTRTDIDRESDMYHKVVTDPKTGTIQHEQHEPLSEHRNRGSAKNKKRNV